MAKSGGKKCFDAGKIGFCHSDEVFKTKVGPIEVVNRPRCNSPLHFDIENI